MPKRIRKPQALLLVVAMIIASCSPAQNRAQEKDATASSSALVVSPAHVNAQRGVPTFVWLREKDVRAHASALEAAKGTLETLSSTFKLSGEARENLVLASVHEGDAGPVVARFEQSVRGIEVFRSALNIVMDRSYRPVAASAFLTPSTDGAERPFAIDAANAVNRARAFATSASSVRGELAPLVALSTDDIYERFTAPDLRQPARAKRVFFPKDDGTLEPAYYSEIFKNDGFAHSYVVSAVDGGKLFENDLVHSESFTYDVYADKDTLIPLDGPQGNALAPHPTGKPDGLVPVWGKMGPVTLANYPFSKNDPWLAPTATTTEGNNASTYADLAEGDGFSASTADRRATTTSPLTFAHPYDTTLSPSASPTNITGSVTQLFYVLNFLHDWFYDSGFDEASGNHQRDNFSRGGRGNDPVLGEAQDYSGRNNANAAVPADGASPRIQMYIFSGPSSAGLTVAPPSSIAGNKAVGTAGFGVDSFTTTGTVALAVDDQGVDTNDACEPLTAAVTGKIVLVHRGLCSFVAKAENAQAAGAAGIIIVNVASSAAPTTPPFMGGTSSTITIPVLSLALADGQALEGAIAGGVSVTMKRSVGTDLDGALDTSVVAHEWGHVLSNRLIGDANGLRTNQAGGLGEGWGDFTSMLLLMRADDIATASGANWAGAYANGAYAMSGSGADFYFGIRRVPYSVDFAKDPLTFKHIENGTPLPSNVPISFGEDGSFNSEVHSTGEVWATMLFECYVALLRDPRYTFTEAQERMKRYLVASLKLTPIEPTLLEARDAVLAAALATDAEDFSTFFAAFARRGAGVGATGPAKDSTTNGPVVESFEVGNHLEITSAALLEDVLTCDHDGLLDRGERGTVAITVRNAGAGTVAQGVVTATTTAQGIVFDGGGVVQLGVLMPFETKAITIPVRALGVDPITSFSIDLLATDPTIPEALSGHASVKSRAQADEAADASATDSVETRATAFTTAGRGGDKWSRTTEGSNSYWTIPDLPTQADQQLVSPAIALTTDSFGLSFRHRYSFRFSTRRNAAVDGGVVELSFDGATWQDASTFGKIDYNEKLSSGGNGNALSGRDAYGSRSVGYPEQWITSHVDFVFPEVHDQVFVRFRVASADGFTGSPGWDIDDIELTGVANTPFVAFVPHADACDEAGPKAFAGSPQTVTSGEQVAVLGSGTHPANLPLSFTWIQVDGPRIDLQTPDAARTAFFAPRVTETTFLTLALYANDGTLVSAPSTVRITVDPDEGCSCKTTSTPAPSNILFGLVAFLFIRRRRTSN